MTAKLPTMEQGTKTYSFLTRHLDEIGESYIEHLLFTLKIGSLMLTAALAIITHGLMPFLFETTGSDMIAHINKLLSDRRAQLKKPE